MQCYLAIDIGASSGRHIVGYQKDGTLHTDEVYRFPNGVCELDGHLTWDTEALFSHVKIGIAKALTAYPTLKSVAIDTWGVDYVLLRGDEPILPCYAYRDARTDASIPRVHEKLPFEALYAKTGIQFCTFNTVYQLYEDQMRGRLDDATDFLMMPEYLSYRLTGVKKKEYTIATTTGMVHAKTKAFDSEIITALGLPAHLFSRPLCAPGETVGPLTDAVAAEVGGQIEVRLCASHDTASAVEGIPMTENSPYISSGTWSLLGIKSPHAICDAQSREANFSNEGGVGYIRYQKNIMGLWIVQSLQRELCPDTDFATIANRARESDFCGTVDVNDRAFLAPKSMKDAIDACFAQEKKPKTTWDYFNCAFRSLALCYRDAIAELSENTRLSCEKLYIVGGGAKNTYLNELTAQACGIEVCALPIEATAIGNLLVQMRSAVKT